MVPFERVLRFGGQTSVMLGFPTGSAYSGTRLGSLAGVLIQVEGGPDVILFDRLVLGFNFGIGYVAPGSDLANACEADGSASCGAIHLDIGAHAEFRFVQDANYIIVPWVGVEGGYEGFYVFENYQDGSSTNVSFGGGQFEIRAGADFTRSLERGWGGFLSYRFGQYSSVSTNDTSTVYQVNYTITNEAEHGWFMIGIRGRF